MSTTIPAKALFDAIDSVSKATAKLNGLYARGPALNSVFIENADRGVRLWASDGNRLAKYDIFGFLDGIFDSEDQCVVPIRPLKGLKGIFDPKSTISVKPDSNLSRISFSNPSANVSLDYTNHKGVYVRWPNSNVDGNHHYELFAWENTPQVYFQVNRKELLDAINSASKELRYSELPILFKFSDLNEYNGSLQVWSHWDTEASSKFPVHISSYRNETDIREFVVAYKARSVMDGLAGCKSKRVTIKMARNEPIERCSSSIIIKDESFSYLLMEFRLAEWIYDT